jgi:hypothetical protein
LQLVRILAAHADPGNAQVLGVMRVGLTETSNETGW